MNIYDNDDKKRKKRKERMVTTEYVTDISHFLSSGQTTYR